MDIRKFFIRPNIPEKLIHLREIARNAWSCWDEDAKKIFHRLDPQLFRSVDHNPIEVLYRVSSERLLELSEDKGFLFELQKVYEKFKSYLEFQGSYEVNGQEKYFSKDDIVVYTCMEYGIHESIPLYSGGLAVLAGDQLKAVSDVGFSMVSFGLLYNFGYFKQNITRDGSQIEEYRENSWYLSAVEEVFREDGSPLLIEIPLKGSMVLAKLWKIQVGQNPLYLLSTNIHQNPPKFRNISNRLYDSDREVRLQQELILGRGSVIALRALNISPKVFHINEGHTAFLILERLLELVKEKGLSLEDATNIIRTTTVFTTHTPVIEGNEHFDEEKIEDYLENEIKQLGLTTEEFLSLGKIRKEKTFWLPVFAMRHSRCINGVSKLHAAVSRNMWRGLFSTMHEREYPIDGITNGVHLQSWLSLQMTDLFDRYIGPDYFQRKESPGIWENVYKIPDGEIWNAHRRRKEQVISFIRRRVWDMMARRGYGKYRIRDVEDVLNPDHLIIGFARRFAPYKRANLILEDPERLRKIITNKDKPVQIIFAGKAHPADAMGKGIIKQIYNFISEFGLEKQVLFLEDYDINIARHLVQGVDVWLNTPLKPMEASGTSGIKAAINGILNLSILDGWWPEAYNGENGWAISSGEVSDDSDVRKTSEASHLYDLLENEVTEFFYDRTENDIPLEWVRMMKNSIVTVCSEFNMARTVREYVNKFYMPQIEMYSRVTANDNKLLKEVKKFKKKLDVIWPKIHIRDYFTSIDGKMPVSGQEVSIDCYVYLGDTDEKMITTEVFYCYGEKYRERNSLPLSFIEKYEDKVGKFSGKITLHGGGVQEISARVVPADNNFRELYPEYIKWKD